MKEEFLQYSDTKSLFFMFNVIIKTDRVVKHEKDTIERRLKINTQHLSGTLLVQKPKKDISIAPNPDMNINICIYELK